MTAFDLPQYIIDLEKQHQGIQFGDIVLKIKKASGRVVKLVPILTNSIRFRNNEEALLYLVDAIKSLPTDKSGTLQLKIEHKYGKVTKLEATRENEVDYPMDAPKGGL